MPASFLKSLFIFGRELFINPGSTGAACPSSPFLANKMASYIPSTEKGWIIEVGAGTGAVTQALINHGVAPQRLISIEMSPTLSRHLAERFPEAHVKQGDAADLASIITQVTGQSRPPIRYIVSSLPFRSLPDKVSEKIIAQIESVLEDDGKLIQFTYDLRNNDFHHFANFEREASSIVLLNFPPARVDLFGLKVGSS